MKGDEETKRKKKMEKIEIIRTKIKAVGRMHLIYKNLKDYNMILLGLKHQSCDGKIPRGLLLAGKEGIR
jgi:hypothetical protein